MKVKKAIIPAAGLGTRFLPATKAQPKEMLPIVDKPAIQYIVEEAVQSGIESIIIVTGRNKKSIEDHFDRSIELEQMLSITNKTELLEKVRSINNLASIHYIRQKEPLGLGHAILCAKQFIGDDPFAVLLGDDIFVSDPPAMEQLIQTYEEYDKQVIGVKPVSKNHVNKYGIVQTTSKKGSIHEVNGLVEKPSIEEAPSNIAIMGRYVLKPTIFPIIEKLQKGAGGEYQLTDALHQVSRAEGLLALELTGSRYDIGDKFGYLQAILEIGLQSEELAPVLYPYLLELVERTTEPKISKL
ncbi:UTP--glucose-1-phosphate uridylyltransferase GalU [Paenibacillus sp. 453mf]|uniref:UTP--glucose-1-phosphate uridylyltransferase GalU n=1 Tax=Paenibacillus sp. 453mf TaxID=1761874 RepID=UPI0008E726C5|nr:UTP--glucose-1-phosphate uridylyltransferase GalU [Paenibacillus sp. 453mf]SFS55757.1 UDP-glucose pyrophosphorylase [Paenibacillus sp. 453mf]